jgi:zinc transport system permease protein
MLAYEFMRRALWAGLITGVLCSAVSFFVFLRRLAHATTGIAHAAFGGVAIAIYCGIDPTLGALAVAVLAALLIGYLGRRGATGHDSATGVISAGAMALGIVLLGLMRRWVPDLYSYLFGSILAVRAGDLRLLGLAGAAILGLLAVWFGPLLFLAFDEDAARAAGLAVGWLDSLLLVLVAVTVVLAVRVLGVVLASALLVAPAATAFQLSRDYRAMLGLAVAGGTGSCLLGLCLSYRWGLASGATITLCAAGLFVLAALASPFRRRGTGGRRQGPTR